MPDQPVAAPHDVAAILESEMGALVAGRAPDAADVPHRADWDADARTLRVRYGDGLEVDVVVQVNESVPPGRSIVVRPPMEVVDGVWRQTGAAGVVLSPHVPADPVARAVHVQDALDTAWRTLHGEVAGHLRPPDGPPPAEAARADAERASDAARPDAGPAPEAVRPDALRALEEPVHPDLPVRDADDVGRHQAAPVDAPVPAPLTPDAVREALTGRGMPEQLTRWAGEHLATRGDDGSLRPRSADDIAATVRELADQAIDLVTPKPEADPAGPRAEADPVGPRADADQPAEVTHTASRIGDTAFVPDGRPWNQPDVTVREVHDAALGVTPRDFADNAVLAVVPDGPTIRVEAADGSPQHFVAQVRSGMEHLAETTLRAGTPEDPHLVRVNDRVAADQLTRVWVHEITETLALRHAEQTRPQPHGLVRRAMTAIARIFGGAETAPAAPRVDPHVAARLNERLHLQRLHDWAQGRPEEQARITREITGLERDLADLGHPVRQVQALFQPARAPIPDGVIRGGDDGPPGRGRDDGPSAWARDNGSPVWGRDEGAPGRDEPEPVRPEPEAPRPEETHDAHWTDRAWERENRPPSLDELIPLTEAEAAKWGADVQAEIAKLIEGRDFGGFRVRFDPHEAHAVSVGRNSVTIRMKVYDAEGAYAGHTTRVFSREYDGTLYVTHNSIQLHEAAQGRGFAHHWNEFLTDWYRYSGVDYVEVHAVNRGGYAWARDGFDWAPNTEHRSNAVLDRLRAGVRTIDEHLDQLARWERGDPAVDVDPLLRRYGVDDPAQLGDRMRHEQQAAREILDRARTHRFGSDGYPTPYEISQAGSAGRNGRGELWIGKEALLGSDWKGVKPITDGVVRHPRVELPERPGEAGPAPRPGPDEGRAPHDHDLFSRESERTNADVLENGSDVPFTQDAVAHVAEMMGIDLSGVDIHLVTHADEVRYFDLQRAVAVTPPEMGGRQIRFGPAAFADAETLAATVAHEYTHVVQLREGRDVSTGSLRALEDEAYASEGPALERFRESFRGWEHAGTGPVLDRGSLRPAEQGRPAGDGGGPRGPDLGGRDPAGRGDRGDGDGAGRGVRDPEEPGGEPRDAGGRADAADTGGRRPHPDDLARRIGRRSDAPFDYEQFYRDPEWTPEALAYEMQLGVHFFNDGPAREAVASAVRQMHEVLTDLATTGVTDPAARQAIAREVELAFFRADSDAFSSAGQVGHGVPLETLLREGNLRELTTAFYNAAYFNRASPHTLAHTLLRVIDEGLWTEARRAGVDVAELRGMQRQLDESLNRAIMSRVEDRLGLKQPKFFRDAFATANVIMRSDRPYRDLVEVVGSQKGRLERTAEDQLRLATTPEHYERLGAPLGRFERAFVETIVGGRLAPDTPLPWREGYVWHDTGGSAWARSVGRDGYVVLDGVSATTTRMLTGAKFLGIHGAQAERFLHGLIGWMLPARDHSLFELLRGASIAGVEPVTIRPRSARPTAIDLYRNLPGVDLRTIRTSIAPDGLLPHEARYASHALDPDGFTETQHKVQDIADRLWPQFESGRVTDADLAAWLDRNGIDPHDPAAVRELADRLTKPHLIALSVYTRHSHYLINNAITAQMVTMGHAEPVVRARHDAKIGQLVDNYLGLLAKGEKPLPLPLALRPVLHHGAGHLDSTSPMRPSAERYVEAVRRQLAAAELADRAAARGDSDVVRAARTEERRAERLAGEERARIGAELAEVAPRLFDEVRWHADMVYDALMQLPTVGRPDAPVIAYRGDWTTPVVSPIYGSKMLPNGQALSVLSVSRLPEVAVRFMEENPASERRVIAVYRLTGVNARDISVFSSFPKDQEAVLPPGSRTRQVSDPELEQQVREQLPPRWRDRCRIIVLTERDGA